MYGSVGNTDHAWYTFLLRLQRQRLVAEGTGLDEVNFWKPSGAAFHALAPGEPFFFKLKAQYDHVIVGFGFFARFEVLADWLAWDAFGKANGNPDLESLRRQTRGYRERNGTLEDGQNRIGCILLSEPVFFGEKEWIRPPADWAPNIVTTKKYDLNTGEGRRIFDECQAQARLTLGQAAGVRSVVAPGEYGAPATVRPRLGQGTFRIAVTSAYQGACAITGEHSLPVLEAAHIQPFAVGPNDVTNGILLRSDIHRLFDRGYVTVTPDRQFEVSRRLKEEFDNGKVYYDLAGRRIRLPDDPGLWPQRDLLDWHHRNVFLG